MLFINCSKRGQNAPFLKKMHPLFVCPKVFSVRRAVSIPTWSQDDTVMAVAADSHRDFLTPERLNVRQRAICPMNCVLFVCTNYYIFSLAFCQAKKRTSAKTRHSTPTDTKAYHESRARQSVFAFFIPIAARLSAMNRIIA